MEDEVAYSLESDEVTSLECDPCKHDGQDIEATGFCVNCHEFLCGTCCKYHTKPLPSRDHTILNKGEMPKKKPLKPSLNVEGKDSTTDNLFDECLTHEGEYLKYYCGYHIDFGCTVCMTIGHRACEHVQYIPKLAKTFKDTAEFNQFEQKLLNLTIIAREQVNKAKGDKRELDRSYNETKEHIEEFRIKLNERLDQLQSEIKLKADELMKECTEKMNQVEKAVCEVAEQIANLKVDVDNLVQTRQHAKLFIKMKRSEDEVNNLSAVVNQTVNKVKAIELKFKPDDKLKAIVNDLSSFGNCKMKISHEETTLTYLREFSVRSSTDENLCNIIDLVMLSDNLLVLADKSNNKVKVLDMKTCVISAEHIISDIRAITRIDETKVAVSYPNTIELLSIIDNGIFGTTKITINDCHSLQFLKTSQHIIAMTTYRNTSVKITDLKGTVMKTFKPSFELKGTGCITKGIDDRSVYTTDVDGNRIVSYTMDGTRNDIFISDTYITGTKRNGYNRRWNRLCVWI